MKGDHPTLLLLVFLHLSARDVRYLLAVLPPKQEWVLFCSMSKFQSQLYKAFLR